METLPMFLTIIEAEFEGDTIVAREAYDAESPDLALAKAALWFGRKYRKDTVVITDVQVHELGKRTREKLLSGELDLFGVARIHDGETNGGPKG